MKPKAKKMTKSVSAKIKRQRMESKRLYSREWYHANKMYKRTYCRFWRALQKKHLTREVDQYNTALDILILDRRTQVKRGKWIDERTGSEYRGIRARGASTAKKAII